MSFVIFGCQKDVSVTEPECSDCPAKSDIVSLDKAGGEFKQAVRQELEKIAKHLAQNRVAVSNSLPAKVFERDGETVLSELAVASALPKQFLRKDGRRFEVNFALAKKSPAENIASQLRVTVDPDDYPIDEEGTFVAYFLDDKGNLKSETTDIESYNNTKPWPLLLINTFEHLPERSLGKISAPIPGSYIGLTHIDIKHEMDGAGYEEFEIFIREDIILEDVLNYCAGYIIPETFDVGLTTMWIFEDRWVYDAANNYRFLRDFNTDNGGYHEADDETHQPIAMIRLDSEKKGLTPIEDDSRVGTHVNYEDGDPCINESRFNSIRADRWDLGYEQSDVLRFHIRVPDPYEGADDLYTKSGAFGFTLNNSTGLSEDTWDADNADVGLRLTRENF